MIREVIRSIGTMSLIIFISLIILDGYVWFHIVNTNIWGGVRDYFLDVGQGDSELIMFPGNIKIMTDAGPTDKVMTSLSKIMPVGDRYIDIAIISHPQLDHFNGYNFILDQYSVGAVIYNGRDDSPGVKEWPELLAKIKAKNIPFITLLKGDKIRFDKDVIDFLSPSRPFDQSAELNDTGFIEFVRAPEFTTLLTADTGTNVENELLKTGLSLKADVLKVGHHGSKTSSGDPFLRAVNPEVAVIEVGAKNSYGHPSKETLERLANSTKAKVFRTDQNGTIEVSKESGKLRFLLYN